LSKAVFLDTGILGFVTHPKADNDEVKQCIGWLHKLLKAGVRICVAEVCDYELRRDYLLRNATSQLRHLDGLNARVSYIPINTKMMVRAAELWAEVRRIGKPTADEKELDCDVILAAQAQVATLPEEDLVIATTNVGHLERFVKADSWRNITPN
jgi:hypothetical protein